MAFVEPLQCGCNVFHRNDLQSNVPSTLDSECAPIFSKSYYYFFFFFPLPGAFLSPFFRLSAASSASSNAIIASADSAVRSGPSSADLPARFLRPFPVATIFSAVSRSCLRRARSSYNVAATTRTKPSKSLAHIHRRRSRGT